jgi:hypothetical protein
VITIVPVAQAPGLASSGDVRGCGTANPAPRTRLRYGASVRLTVIRDGPAPGRASCRYDEARKSSTRASSRHSGILSHRTRSSSTSDVETGQWFLSIGPQGMTRTIVTSCLGARRFAADRLSVSPAVPVGTTFDFVFSDQVLEHVSDYEAAKRDQPCPKKVVGGLSTSFPSKVCAVEPHSFVPLATVLRSRHWLRLWAAIGIRNRYQKGKECQRRSRAKPPLLNHRDGRSH